MWLKEWNTLLSYEHVKHVLSASLSLRLELHVACTP